MLIKEGDIQDGIYVQEIALELLVLHCHRFGSTTLGAPPAFPILKPRNFQAPRQACDGENGVTRNRKIDERLRPESGTLTRLSMTGLFWVESNSEQQKSREVRRETR